MSSRGWKIGWTLLLVAAGAAHLWRPDFFTAYYPAYLPWPHEAVMVTAWLEWILALGLWHPRTASSAWTLIGLLMLLYVPVHVYVITHHAEITHPVPAVPRWLAWLRLPVQGLLIWSAWRMRR